MLSLNLGSVRPLFVVVVKHCLLWNRFPDALFEHGIHLRFHSFDELLSVQLQEHLIQCVHFVVGLREEEDLCQLSWCVVRSVEVLFKERVIRSYTR